MTHHHGEDIAKAVATIALHWNASLRGPKEGASGGKRPAPTSRTPVPPAVLDARALALSRMTGWALVVIDDRELSAHVDGNDALALAELLLTHADWLGHHEASADAVAELADSARQILALATGTRRRRITIGSCPQLVVTEGGEPTPCPGRLHATLHTTDVLLPASIACTVNPAHTWSPREWVGLGLAIAVATTTRRRAA